MGKFKTIEEELWDSLSISGESAPAQDEKPVASNRTRQRLAKAAALPVASEPTPWEAEHADVVQWLRSYTGTFEFYLSVRGQYEHRGELSEKQVDAIRRAIARDTKPQVKHDQPAPQPRKFTLEAGEILRVSKFLAGKLGRESGLTRAHFVVEVLQVSAETDKAYRAVVEMSAQRTNVCMVCGRTLDNPESVMRGIGPVCGESYSLDWKSDRDALEQLAELFRETAKPVEVWIPKSQIKERVK